MERSRLARSNPCPFESSPSNAPGDPPASAQPESDEAMAALPPAVPSIPRSADCAHEQDEIARSKAPKLKIRIPRIVTPRFRPLQANLCLSYFLHAHISRVQVRFV